MNTIKHSELYTLKGWVVWHVNFISVCQRKVIYFYCRKIRNQKKAGKLQQVRVPLFGNSHARLFSVSLSFFPQILFVVAGERGWCYFSLDNRDANYQIISIQILMLTHFPSPQKRVGPKEDPFSWQRGIKDRNAIKRRKSNGWPCKREEEAPERKRSGFFLGGREAGLSSRCETWNSFLGALLQCAWYII